MNHIVDIARSYLGTPYHHQGRVKGPSGGVDCVGLMILVAREIGSKSRAEPDSTDYTGYQRVPDGKSMMALLNAHMLPISREAMAPGDVVCVTFDKDPQHVGILGDYRHGGLSIIHAVSRYGKVIESRLLFNEQLKFVAAFRFPDH